MNLNSKIEALYLEYINENTDVTSTLGKSLAEKYEIEDEADKEVFVKALESSIKDSVLTITKDFIENKVSNIMEEYVSKTIFEEIESIEYRNELILENTIKQIIDEYRPYFKNNVLNENNKMIVDRLVSTLQEYNVNIPEDKLDYCHRLEENIRLLEQDKNNALNACDERDDLLKTYIKKEIIRKTLPDKSEIDIERMFDLTESFELEYNDLNKYKDHVLFVEKTYVQKPVLNENFNNVKTKNKMPRLI